MKRIYKLNIDGAPVIAGESLLFNYDSLTVASWLGGKLPTIIDSVITNNVPPILPGKFYSSYSVIAQVKEFDSVTGLELRQLSVGGSYRIDISHDNSLLYCVSLDGTNLKVIDIALWAVISDRTIPGDPLNWGFGLSSDGLHLVGVYYNSVTRYSAFRKILLSDLSEVGSISVGGIEMANTQYTVTKGFNHLFLNFQIYGVAVYVNFSVPDAAFDVYSQIYAPNTNVRPYLQPSRIADRVISMSRNGTTPTSAENAFHYLPGGSWLNNYHNFPIDVLSYARSNYNNTNTKVLSVTGQQKMFVFEGFSDVQTTFTPIEIPYSYCVNPMKVMFSGSAFVVIDNGRLYAVRESDYSILYNESFATSFLIDAVAQR